MRILSPCVGQERERCVIKGIELIKEQNNLDVVILVRFKDRVFKWKHLNNLP